MPAIPSNAKNFSLNTDYPIDDLVFINRGSRVIPGSTFSDFVTFEHKLPFSPLPLIVWSLTADFATTYVNSDNSGNVFVSVSANATNVTISSSNFNAGAVTVYYKILAFPPSGASLDADVIATASEGEVFTLNTDRNYMKLVKSGVLSTSDRIHNHDVGEIPTVFVWLNSTHEPNVLAQWVVVDPAGNAGIKLTTTTIEFVGASVNDTAVEYRIYADN